MRHLAPALHTTTAPVTTLPPLRKVTEVIPLILLISPTTTTTATATAANARVIMSRHLCLAILTWRRVTRHSLVLQITSLTV